MKRLLVAALLVCLLSPGSAHAATPHPHLGETLSTWVHDWGYWARNTYADTGPGWQTCPGSRTVRVMTFVVEGQVIVVDGQLCHGMKKPTTTQAVAQARLFFPKDTVSKGRVVTHQAVILLYYSASLAKTQAAKDLTRTCGKNSVVKPGQFTLIPDNDGAGDWALELGSCVNT
jgi:hypothetical protein